MLVVILVMSIFYLTGQCQVLAPAHQHDDQELIQCILGILNKYFSKQFELTFVDIHSHADQLLRAVHSTMNYTLISRLSTHQMFVPNIGYLVSSTDVVDFVKYFKYLIREAAWNPYARFVIVVRSLRDVELRLIFDELLRLHVNNALIVNGTDDAHLYGYNPFDKYACGKRYDAVISYGRCSQTPHDLYPNKLITGLKNCHIRAMVAHRPPLTLDPRKTEHKKAFLGSEEYVITLLAEAEQFTVSFNYSYDPDSYSTVFPNMTAFGPMEMLQNNTCDVIFGCLTMVEGRATGFSFLGGYHDYIDELRFAVRRASVTPTWKFIYLEFNLDVWGLLVVTFVVFSNIAVILLRTEDRGDVVLRLFDNLLLHGREVHSRLTVKCVFITWVWFAYLINTFYQSNLFSLTTRPGLEHQVSDEDDIIKYDYKPCFSKALQLYVTTESSKLANRDDFRKEGCDNIRDMMDTLCANENLFTLVPNYFFLYNEAKFIDKWGDPLIYYFDKPYTTFLFSYYFYKGFPITQSMQLNAMRTRETGLAEKVLKDHYYIRRLKQNISHKTFESRFLIPWHVCVPGLALATIAFIFELLVKHSTWFHFLLVTFNKYSKGPYLTYPRQVTGELNN